MNFGQKRGWDYTMRLLLRMAVWLVTCVPLAGSLTAAPLPRSVLIIDQYGPGLPFSAGISSGIREAMISGSATQVSVYHELLDVNRFRGSVYEHSLNAHFRLKYRDKPIGVIIAVGPAALEYVLRSRAELWPEIPVVFTFVDKSAITQLALPPDVTGNTLQSHPRDMVTVARTLVPDIKRIALVGDPPENQTYYRDLKKEIPIVAADLEFIDLTGLTMTELRKRVAALPDQTAILHTSIYSDGEGNSLIPADAVALVAEMANRPIVVDLDTHFGRGTVGGLITSSSSLGEAAAKIALRILDGESASNISIKESELARPIFDWRQLKRFGISETKLPPGSEVRFREPTAWEQYSSQITIIFAALLAQAAMIGWLLLEHNRRRLAELESGDRLREVIHLERVAAVGAMSASIAHELNQPLQSILTDAETAEYLLAANPIDRDRLKEIIADIQKSDERAAEIIAHMRLLLKKRGAVELQELDLNDAIRDALDMIGPEARKKGILVSDYRVQGALHVRADRVHLEQVIVNLATNAMDAMKDCAPGTRKLTLQTALVGDFKVEVSVSDTGTGIPNDKLKGVFETFYTTKQQGTGLGLSIVRTIVETYGGKIWAENRNGGGGAVFRFTLPLAKAHAA